MTLVVIMIWAFLVGFYTNYYGEEKGWSFWKIMLVSQALSISGAILISFISHVVTK